ncbi:MAG: mechanosensitive ion channel [Motiliproteus sp.]|nr:mechanosensitive ion channel [Motiliproteus sp.]
MLQHLLFRRLSVSSLLVIIFAIFPLAATYAESETLLIKSTKLDFNNVEAGWWTGFDSLDSTEKLVLVKNLSDQINLQSERLPTGVSENENVRILPAILKQLSSSISADQPTSESPKLLESYSFMDWLALFSRVSSLDKQLTIQQHERIKLTNSLKLLKQDLATLFVEYRPLAGNTNDRLSLGAKIVRQQFTYLLYQAKVNNLKQLVREKSSSQTAYTEALNAAKLRLISTEQESKQLERKIEESIRPQAALLKEIEQLEIDQIGNNANDRHASIILLERNTSLRKMQLQQLKYQLIYSYGHLLRGDHQIQSENWADRLAEVRTFYETHREQFREIFNASSNIAIEGVEQQPNESNGKQQQRLWLLLQTVQTHLNVIESLLIEIEFVLENYKGQLKKSANGWDWIKGLFDTSYKGSLDAAVSVIQFPLFTVNETPVTLIDIARVTFILLIAVIISRMVRKGLAHMGQNFRGFSEASLFAISKIIHYLILIIALIMGLSSIGLDFTNLALVAGALSVGIGFGLQSIFNNFISGLILLIERPLKVGDVVELESGVRGRIKAINVRSTQLTTRDNIDILVPNSEFISGRVTNYTLDDSTRRLRIPFGVAYGSDKQLVKKAAIEAAKEVPYTVTNYDKEIEISMIAFGASSLDFELIVWIDNNNMPPKNSIVSMYLWEIESKFNEYQIEIPFPQQDIYVRSVPDNG